MFATNAPYAVQMAKSYRAEQIKAAEDYHHVRQAKRDRVWRKRASKTTSRSTAVVASSPQSTVQASS